MPKSRKTARIKRKNRVQRNKRCISVFFVFGFAVLALIAGYFIYKISTIEKFSYVQKSDNGDAQIVVYDPHKESVTEILIPGNTQLELSYGLGDYRLKNVWKLAESENLKGVLVARTLVKNFSIPVYLYKIGNFTNLDILKRIKVWTLDKKLGGVSRNQLNLSDTQVLKEKRLLDGEVGLTVYGEIPSYIVINFAQTGFGEFVPMVDIVDKSGDYKISDSVSKVLSVMGAKVSSYSKQTPQDFNCTVSGKNIARVKTTALIFACDIKNDVETESDLQINIGKDFVKIF